MNNFKNRYLSRSISDVSWKRFLQILKSKAAEAGILAIEVNSKNTSLVWSGCGNLVSKTLSTRKHKCQNWGLIIERDIKAAKNILQLALNTLGARGIEAGELGDYF